MHRVWIMKTPAKVIELIERFDRNLDAYKQGRYNETQLRREFIDPFFKALGWDVWNEKGYAEAYKDVVHEDAIKVGGATKAPDYCFRIGGVRKFFLEAKKPSVDIKDSIHPAYQLRRYAWSAKLPLSILTDFEEFAVYDCRVKPLQTDKASTARIIYHNYREYQQKWEEIANIFSREAILKGSFDKYVESKKARRGTAEVDNAFLQEIERWREMLARNIALCNPKLTQRELNFSVQRTIDRIIFLRICEDRGIETYGTLMALQNGNNIYKRLFERFHQADDRYNSGLFHFREEKNYSSDSLDTLTPELNIDDKVLKDILKNLYYPDSPYEFSVLPADILGQVYEQFLGKVIRLTPGHRAVVEHKPEIRKAGGVYYTPTYIVDYIVKNTVGKLLEGKKPGPKSAASKLKILDPACGSGSFLLGAYQYLLDWQRDKYFEDGPEKWATGRTPRLYQSKGGEWKLTTTERKRILLNNIYGVDIDPQAVEVTKLSLLLKVLEGEDEQTITRQLALFHQRVLPDLGNNIKCGNSLIGPDFYEGTQMSLLDDEEIYRINAFDWKAEFAEIMAAGGFDAVIGNPPYIGFHGFKENKSYLTTHYLSAEGRYDVYLPFIEKGLNLLRENCLMGIICPTNFTKRKYGNKLRNFLKNNITIITVVDFHDIPIFKGALNYTGIFIFRKSKPIKQNNIKYLKRSLEDHGYYVSQQNLDDESWIFRDKRSELLIQKIKNQGVAALSELSTGITEGIVTGKNEVFLLKEEKVRELGLEPQIVKQCVRGNQIRRYFIQNITEYVIYPYELVGDKINVMSVLKLRTFYPKTWFYLEAQRKKLIGRDYFDNSKKAWYELWCQRNMEELSKKKILVPELADSNRFALADEYLFYGDTVCGITIKDVTKGSIFYILGILNSRLIEYFYKQTTVPKANRFYIYKTMFLKNIPIRTINFTDSNDEYHHYQIVELVQRMLNLHKQYRKAKEPQAKTVLQRQIETTDRQIDQLVYKLYDLTDEEIKIVEESLK